MDYFNMVVAEIHGIRPMELVEHHKGGRVVGSLHSRSGRGGGGCRRQHRHGAVQRLPVLGAELAKKTPHRDARSSRPHSAHALTAPAPMPVSQTCSSRRPARLKKRPQILAEDICTSWTSRR